MDDPLIASLACVGGFVLLLLGADYLVRGAVGLSRRIGMSPLVIGLTVVALGTSLPELTVSLKAALAGSPGLTIGNIVGSNIANILLILGVGALLAPVGCTRQALFRDGSAVVVATTLFIACGMTGSIGRVEGIVAVILLFGFLYYSYLSDRRSGDGHAREAEDVEALGSLGPALAAVVGGLIAVLIGAEFLVNGAVELARVFGVSDEVIGLTLVAFGTSVPELATTIVAGIRRHGDVALGNVLGSNLFNTLGIMGAVTIVVPIEVPDQIRYFDFWVMAAATLLVFLMLRTSWRLCRREAAFLLCLYGLFIASQVFGVGQHVAASVAGL